MQPARVRVWTVVHLASCVAKCDVCLSFQPSPSRAAGSPSAAACQSSLHRRVLGLKVAMELSSVRLERGLGRFLLPGLTRRSIALELLRVRPSARLRRRKSPPAAAYVRLNRGERVTGGSGSGTKATTPRTAAAARVLKVIASSFGVRSPCVSARSVPAPPSNARTRAAAPRAGPLHRLLGRGFPAAGLGIETSSSRSSGSTADLNGAGQARRGRGRRADGRASRRPTRGCARPRVARNGLEAALEQFGGRRSRPEDRRFGHIREDQRVSSCFCWTSTGREDGRKPGYCPSCDPPDLSVACEVENDPRPPRARSACRAHRRSANDGPHLARRSAARSQFAIGENEPSWQCAALPRSHARAASR